MIHPEMLAQILSQGSSPGSGPGAGGPPPDPDDEGKRPPTPTEAVQDCIQDLHELLTLMPDPAHVQMATQALGILTKIQRDLMQPKGGGGAAGAMTNQLTG